jgi:uncharacterized protein YukE
MTNDDFDAEHFVDMAFKAKEGFGKTVKYVPATRIEALERENKNLRQIERNVQDAREHEFKRAETTELALTQSRAETAAAYERAADRADNDAQMYWENGAVSASAALVNVAAAIRALATPEQSAALDAVKAEAWAQGMREAAEIADELAEEVSRGHDNGERASIRILAAIQKGEPK